MFDSYKRDKELGIVEEEIPHKRKKESSTSHSSAKAKHKHEYKPCKFKYSNTYAIPGKDAKTYTFIDTGKYCIICGRINDRKMLHTEDFMKSFDLENPDAPIFEVDGYMDKFVNI